MNRDNLRLVLSYCKLNPKFFEISKDIESVYCQIVYSSPLGQKKIKIESYEQNEEFIYFLYHKGAADFSLYNYWLQNHSHGYKLKIYWKELLYERFNTIDDIIADLLIDEYEILTNKEIEFIQNFMDFTKAIADKFKVIEMCLLRYRQYQIQYVKNYFLCLDYEHNNFIIFGVNDKDEIEIVCNKFYHRTKYHNSTYLCRKFGLSFFVRALNESGQHQINSVFL